MLKTIDGVVKATSSQGTLVKEKFFVVHFNVLCVVSTIICSHEKAITVTLT
jgi:hypothetical protein